MVNAVRALAIAFLVFTASAQTDFRNASWGMTQAQVMAAELDRPDEIRMSNGATIVEYHPRKIGPFDGRVLYIFAQDKLVRGKFLVEAEHDNANEFIADFRRLSIPLYDDAGNVIWEPA